MDNSLNIDNMDMIRMLGFLHENIKTITYNTVQYTEDGVVSIVNLNDEVIIREKEANIAIFGTFVITGEQALVRGWGWGDQNRVKVTNLLSGESKYFYVSTIREVKSLGDEFIIIEEPSKLKTVNVLYNKFLEPIYDFGYLRFIRVVDDNPLKTMVDYSSEYIGSFRKIILDKRNAKVDMYDALELDERRQLKAIGKEWERRGSKLSVYANFIPNIKYKLSNHDKLVGKCYNAIEATSELSMTDYLLVHELTSKFRLSKANCQGIIDINGVEIIPPVYDKVLYIGANTFLLYFNKFVNVYTVGKEELFKDIPEGNVWIHQTLPMVIIKDTNNYIAIDVFGRQFNVADIAQYFEVSVCDRHEDTFRINTGYKVVYTYKNLIPITNLHQIHILSVCEWKKI